MSVMIQFSTLMLQHIASFLEAEPIIYLFGMILFLVIVKVVLCLISSSFWKGGNF